MKNIMDILNNAALENNSGKPCIVRYNNKNMKGIISKDDDVLRIRNNEILNKGVHLQIGSNIYINSKEFKITNVVINGENTGIWQWDIQKY